MKLAFSVVQVFQVPFIHATEFRRFEPLINKIAHSGDIRGRIEGGRGEMHGSADGSAILT